MKGERLVHVTRFSNMELGKTEIIIDGTPVAIFDRERTIIDAFRLLSRETAIKALKMALADTSHKLDLIKLQNYAQELRFDMTPYLLTATT